MRIAYPGVELDLERRRFRRGDLAGTLTQREADVLRFLYERGGEVVRREALERQVFGMRAGVRSEAVPVAVRRLRAKLEADPARPAVLLTVHGSGWRLVRPEPAPVDPRIPSAVTPYLPRPDLDDAVRRWVDAGHRLVTLCGGGGTGKTRTAAALARWHAARGGGAQFVASPDGPGARVPPGTLLVWDGMDHALDQVRAGVARALADEGVMAVVTARQPLGLPDEVLVSVGGLAPGEGAELLCVRIRAAGGAPPDPAHAAEIVAAVDGLPLAIEVVAAAFARTAGASADAARFPVEVGIRAAIDDRPGEVLRWTLARLRADLREVLARLPVFPDTFDAAAVAEVLGADAAARLAALHQRSLLLLDGERYALPRLVRAILAGGAGALAPSDDDVAAHARWTAARAVALTDALDRDAGPACEAAAVLRADLEAVVERGDGDSAAAAALALSRWSAHADGPRDPRRWLEAASARAPGPHLATRLRLAVLTLRQNASEAVDPGPPLDDPELEAVRIMLESRVHLLAGDPAAHAARRRAVELADDPALPPRLRLELWNAAAQVAALLGQPDEALDHLAEAAAVGVCHGLRALLPHVLAHRGILLVRRDRARGVAMLEEAYAEAVAQRRPSVAGVACTNLHFAHRDQDPALAAAWIARALDHARGMGRIVAVLALATTRWVARDVDGAERAVAAVAPNEIDVLLPPSRAGALLCLAVLHAAAGRIARSRRHFDEVDRAALVVTLRATPAEVDHVMALARAELVLPAARRGDTAAQGEVRQALAAAEGWLAIHDPGSWLFRALVRRRAEEVAAFPATALSTVRRYPRKRPASA
jgi:DNA-binding winged helix-turn-helix (wHTH) protein